jgi:hypothetical protein
MRAIMSTTVIPGETRLGPLQESEQRKLELTRFRTIRIPSRYDARAWFYTPKQYRPDAASG